MKVSDVSSYRWTILLLATLVQVGVSILQQAPAALGPVLIRDLDLSRAQIGLLSSAIWGGMLLAMLPVGLLIDRHGERRLIVAGVTAMALLVLWATQLRAFVLLLILFLCSDGMRRVVLLCGDRNAFTSRAIPKALSNEIGKRHPSCDLCVA